MKAVYLNTGGKYSSRLETQHKIAVAYGSSAGYKHNYIKGNAMLYKGNVFARTEKVNANGIYSYGNKQINLMDPLSSGVPADRAKKIKQF